MFRMRRLCLKIEVLVKFVMVKEKQGKRRINTSDKDECSLYEIRFLPSNNIT